MYVCLCVCIYVVGDTYIKSDGEILKNGHTFSLTQDLGFIHLQDYFF